MADEIVKLEEQFVSLDPDEIATYVARGGEELPPNIDAEAAFLVARLTAQVTLARASTDDAIRHIATVQRGMFATDAEFGEYLQNFAKNIVGD